MSMCLIDIPKLNLIAYTLFDLETAQTMYPNNGTL